MAWRMPVVEYRLCVMTPSGMLELDSLSPQAAMRRDPEKFLKLLKEMWRVARKHKQEQAQSEMALEC